MFISLETPFLDSNSLEEVPFKIGRAGLQSRDFQNPFAMKQKEAAEVRQAAVLAIKVEWGREIPLSSNGSKVHTQKLSKLK